jgi:hypothetical protein
MNKAPILRRGIAAEDFLVRNKVASCHRHLKYEILGHYLEQFIRHKQLCAPLPRYFNLENFG